MHQRHACMHPPSVRQGINPSSGSRYTYIRIHTLHVHLSFFTFSDTRSLSFSVSSSLHFLNMLFLIRQRQLRKTNDDNTYTTLIDTVRMCVRGPLFLPRLSLTHSVWPFPPLSVPGFRGIEREKMDFLLCRAQCINVLDVEGTADPKSRDNKGSLSRE